LMPHTGNGAGRAAGSRLRCISMASSISRLTRSLLRGLPPYGHCARQARRPPSRLQHLRSVSETGRPILRHQLDGPSRYSEPWSIKWAGVKPVVHRRMSKLGSYRHRAPCGWCFR
jgi:hypothetical protein